MAPWFAGVLRDGFALAVLGGSAPFADVAADGLRTVLAGHDLDRPLDEAVATVLAGFAELPVHPDVAAGLPRLAAAGIRMVAMSNGATAVAEQLLTKAGLRGHVEAVLSVEEGGAWKPDARAYAFALRRSQVAQHAATMVACHPWDLLGADAAGLGTVWIDRTGAPGPRPSPSRTTAWAGSTSSPTCSTPDPPEVGVLRAHEVMEPRPGRGRAVGTSG